MAQSVGQLQFEITRRNNALCDKQMKMKELLKQPILDEILTTISNTTESYYHYPFYDTQQQFMLNSIVSKHKKALGADFENYPAPDMFPIIADELINLEYIVNGYDKDNYNPHSLSLSVTYKLKDSVDSSLPTYHAARMGFKCKKWLEYLNELYNSNRHEAREIMKKIITMKLTIQTKNGTNETSCGQVLNEHTDNECAKEKKEFFSKLRMLNPKLPNSYTFTDNEMHVFAKELKYNIEKRSHNLFYFSIPLPPNIPNYFSK